MIALRAVTATPDEIYRVTALLEGVPGTYTAIKHLHATANQMMVNQQLRGKHGTGN